MFPVYLESRESERRTRLTFKIRTQAVSPVERNFLEHRAPDTRFVNRFDICLRCPCASGLNICESCLVCFARSAYEPTNHCVPVAFPLLYLISWTRTKYRPRVPLSNCSLRCKLFFSQLNTRFRRLRCFFLVAKYSKLEIRI